MTRQEELERIAKKRVGRAMEALELAGCGDAIKSAIKKQIWEFKKDIERNVLEKGCENGMDKNTNNFDN